jgi:hypothetical protein
MVAFRGIDLPAASGRPGLRCVLRLERVHRAKVRVVRTLEAADGLTATMTAEGDEPAPLLEAIERVPPARQFHVIEGQLLTRSYRTEVWRTEPPGRRLWPERTAWPRLVGAEARLGPVRFTARDTGGRALEVELAAREAGASLDLPRDLLAVLGWGWRPLRRVDRARWIGSVRPRRGSSKRTARLEAHLDAAVAHVARTLSAAPASFHARHRGARWRAAFQRLLPLLFVLGVALGIAAAVRFLPKRPEIQTLLLYASIAAIAALKMMDKAYKVEIPPPPRPLRQLRWLASSDVEL